MQMYNVFYREKGIRFPNRLVNPPLSPVSEFEVPQNYTLHYLRSEVEYGPDINYAFLKGAKQGAWIEHQLTLHSTEGNPRYISSEIRSDILKYRKEQPNIRLMMRPIDTLRAPLVPLILNYSLIPRAYIYRPNLWTRRNEWANLFQLVCTNFNRASAVPNRQQFLVMDIPEVIPTLNQFNHGAEKLDQITNKLFNTPELLTLLELYKWVGKTKDDSYLSLIEMKALETVNVIFVKYGKYTVLNLGLLASWRKNIENDDVESGVQQLEPEVLQKRLLRFWLTMTDDSVSVDTPDDALIAVTGSQFTDTKTEIHDEEEDADLKDEEVGSDVVDADEHVGGNDIIDSQTDELLETYQRTQLDEGEVSSFDVSDVGVYEAVNPSLEDAVVLRAKKSLEEGSITLQEYQRFERLAGNYQKIKLPYTDQTAAEYSVITPDMLTLTPEETKLVTVNGVVDKTQLNATLKVMDEKYRANILERDVIGAILGFQQAGVVVNDIQVTEHQDISSHYRTYKVELIPVNGKQTTVQLKIPVVRKDGTFLAGGTQYFMKKQRSEMPIRKVSPSRVALTSYYGKVFIDRCQNVSANYETWLNNQITVLGSSDDNNIVTGLRIGALFDSRQKGCPRVYSILAKRFSGFNAHGYLMSFDHPKMISTLNEKGYKVKTIEAEFGWIAGTRVNTDELVCIAKDGTITFVNGLTGLAINNHGSIENWLGLNSFKRPVEYATMTVFSENIPVAYVLGHRMGLRKLINTLGIEVRRVENGKQLNLMPDEFRVRFKDCSLVFKRNDPKAAMIIGGLNALHRSLLRYEVALFDKPDVYINVLEDAGLGIRYTRELDCMFSLFIDPITKGLLQDMGEPTDMVKLLERSVELLTTNYFNEDDGVREKGYERFAGAVYKELVLAYRKKLARPFANRVGIEVNPEASWLNIMTDTSKEVLDEINAIHNLKNKEIVTFGGTGGRSTKTMVKRTRGMQPSDVGVISEATVDSGDVGIITYLSSDPRYISLRGQRHPDLFDFDKAEGVAQLISTSGNLAPCIDTDSVNRANFCSIQNSHCVPSPSYTVMPLTTGYENVIGQRTDDLFCSVAEQDGIVTKANVYGIEITYNNGEVKRIQLGRRYGKTKGTTIPHMVVTDLKEGDKFVAGQTVAWNTGFFEKSLVNPKQAVFKTSMLATTAFLDGPDTLEDSCAISERLSGVFSTEITYDRSIVLNFDQHILNVIKEGEHTEADGILCTIQDPVSANSGLFSEENIETLQMLSDATPKADHKGIVERIECYYNGNIEDMTESLQALVTASDRRLSKQLAMSTNSITSLTTKPNATGKVDSSHRVGGNGLLENQIAIVFYITHQASSGVGDKAVFGNQLKTVVGRVMSGTNRTLSGIPLDALFGATSAENRIVDSIKRMGTTNTVLRLGGKKAISIYRNQS